MLKYIISICLISVAFAANSQKIKLTDIGLGTDLMKIIPSAIDFENRAKGEGYISIVFNSKTELVGEAGYSRQLIYSGYRTNYDYYASGAFARLGADRRFKFSEGFSFIGLRVGGSNFRSRVEYDVHGITGEVPERHFTAIWFEATGGVKFALWKGLHLGMTLRGKLNPFFSQPDDFPVRGIPGYGSNSKINGTVNLTLTYYFPVKKDETKEQQ